MEYRGTRYKAMIRWKTTCQYCRGARRTSRLTCALLSPPPPVSLLQNTWIRNSGSGTGIGASWLRMPTSGQDAYPHHMWSVLRQNCRLDHLSYIPFDASKPGVTITRGALWHKCSSSVLPPAPQPQVSAGVAKHGLKHKPVPCWCGQASFEAQICAGSYAALLALLPGKDISTKSQSTTRSAPPLRWPTMLKVSGAVQGLQSATAGVTSLSTAIYAMGCACVCARTHAHVCVGRVARPPRPP